MTDGVRTRPMTGDEYLESLRDGREIWIYGERVEDVTTHPAFRNSTRMIARMYDALHDPKYKDILTTDTDTGSGGYTHRYFRAPKSGDDQLKARDAIAQWARLSYGWMGRAPDYKASFLGTLGTDFAFYRPHARVRRHVHGRVRSGRLDGAGPDRSGRRELVREKELAVESRNLRLWAFSPS